jgi:hypothetical protein
VRGFDPRHSRGQAFPRDQFHLLAESIELTERSVEVRCNANPLEFFMHDRHGKDVLFVE